MKDRVEVILEALVEAKDSILFESPTTLDLGALAEQIETRLRRESAQVEFLRLPPDGIVVIQAGQAQHAAEAEALIRRNVPEHTRIVVAPPDTRVSVLQPAVHGLLLLTCETAMSMEQVVAFQRQVATMAKPTSPWYGMPVVIVPPGARLDTLSPDDLARLKLRRV